MTGAVGQLPDMAASEFAAELRRRQFATLLEHSPDATVVLDAAGRICEWNPAAETLLGLPRPEVIGVPARHLVPPTYRAQFDAVWSRLVVAQLTPPYTTPWLRPDGSWVSVSTHIASIQASDRFAGAVAIVRAGSAGSEAVGIDAPEPFGATVPTDGTRRLRSAGAPPQLGILERDELTGLPGRRRLQRRLAEPIVAELTRGVAVLDVDAFALVNQTYGPDAGDDVLVELARRLAPMAGAAVLGRWQADAFVWVIDAEDPAAALEALCAAAQAALNDPFHVGTDRLRLTVSTGLVTGALAPGGDLLTAAMDALRTAKDTGRDRAVWYDAAMQTGSTGSFRLANDLHRGIENGELRLQFQPIMRLATNEVVGVEALVRWERPGVGLLSPVSFIDVAERTGQIELLGSWVARHACLAAADLVRVPQGPCTVSMNVSARQLSDPGLVAMLRGALEDSGCAPSTIIVEVTETALMRDLDTAVATLEDIKALGVGLDLDDFGTGYSSLLYLKRFPVDRIKIDQSFVAGLGTNIADTAIVASTIALAHSFGIEAVAEGVETHDQLRLLHQMGCDFAQGYLLSRPLSLGLLYEWLTQHVPAHLEPRDTAVSGVEREPSRAYALDEVADLRDEVADGRDGVADLRDEMADSRDQSGDRRDDASDVRDGLADARDKIADVRDDVAAARDSVADGRDAADGGVGAPGTPEGVDASALARQDAAFGRNRATAQRVTGASERARAERDRDAAQCERESGASERVQAEHDRGAVVTGRKAPTWGRTAATDATPIARPRPGPRTHRQCQGDMT